jgi:LysR family transcriptional activator of nhaA
MLPDINFHHLRVFWAVAHDGSIARACKRLGVAQPTVSEQLRRLAEGLGAELFTREGRRLVLTDTGRLVLDIADDVVALGRELQDALARRADTRSVRLEVGIADSVPKLVAYRLLAPALTLPERVRITVREEPHDRLVAELANHALDLVLTDAPLEAHHRIRAYTHTLGGSVVAFFAPPRLAGLRKGFPASLDGAPVLLPLPGTPQRRDLDGWFDLHGLRPEMVAEFQDSALMKVFAQAGAGVFAGPQALEAEICDQYGVQVIGTAPTLTERYHVISLERRLAHPALVAIVAAAKRILAPERRKRPGG